MGMNDDLGITTAIKWDRFGSWVARVALALMVGLLTIISFFLIRLVEELDDAKQELTNTTRSVYEVKGELNVLQYQVRDIRERLNRMENQIR